MNVDSETRERLSKHTSKTRQFREADTEGQTQMHRDWLADERAKQKLRDAVHALELVVNDTKCRGRIGPNNMAGISETSELLNATSAQIVRTWD